jgi:hypothetical protein
MWTRRRLFIIQESDGQALLCKSTSTTLLAVDGAALALPSELA